jgi:hypothetical protein
LVGLVLLAGLFAPVFADGADISALAPEDLLAAVPALADVSGVVATPADYWPEFPQFYAAAADPAARPGERLVVEQNLVKFNDQRCSRLEATIILFNTPKQAHRAFVDETGQEAQVAAALKAAHVGDESRYFCLAGSPGAMLLYYRLGPMIGRVTLRAPGPPPAPAAVTAFGAALTAKLQDVLDGKLAAPNLPADFDQLMPPAAVTTEVGPVLLSMVLPVETWALTQASNNPGKVRDMLKAGGVSNYYFRRYAVSALPGQVLTATAFQFTDPQAASDWEWSFIRSEAAHGPVYDPGDTGLLRAFTQKDDSNIELEFAKGRLVGDVSGLAPGAALNPKLQPVVRKTAELWWHALPLS